MLNERKLHYVEVDDSVDTTPAKEPRVKGILSLVFGVVSIFLCGILGIVFGVLARRFASPIITDFADTLAAKFSKAGRITGTVGLILSIIDLVIFAAVTIGIVALAVALISMIFNK